VTDKLNSKSTSGLYSVYLIVEMKLILKLYEKDFVETGSEMIPETEISLLVGVLLQP